MYGELTPVGGGDPIPLLKKKLLIGVAKVADIVAAISQCFIEALRTDHREWLLVL